MPVEMIDGLGSGIKTKQMIQKLVEIERRPILQLNRSRKELGIENQALNELRNKTQILQERLKALYSFEAAFGQKKLTLNPKGFVEGVASKKAQNQTLRLEVLQLASGFEASSKKYSLSKKLPRATFSFNGKKVNFPGGNIYKLKELINTEYSKDFMAKVIKVSADKGVLLLRGKKEGLKSLPKILDHDGLLQKIGLYSGKDQPEKENENKKQEWQKGDEKRQPIKLSLANLLQVKEGPMELSPNGSKLTLSELAAQRVSAIPPSLKDHTLKELAFQVNLEPRPPEEKDDAPTSIKEGPQKSLNFKGITISTYNIERTRKRKQVKIIPRDYGISIQTKGGASQKSSLKGKIGEVRFPISKNFDSITFYTNNEKLYISNLEWIYEGKPKPPPPPKKKDNSPSVTKQKTIFPNLIKPASNARIKLDGIEAEREKNKNIDDLIDGVKLNLLKPTTKDEQIRAKIANNSEKAQDQILAFVKAYNELLRYSRDASQTAAVDKAGEFKKLKEQSGILVSNSAVRSLVSGLRNRAANAYPANKEPKIKILSSIGINTGKIGANWEEIQNGELKVDESKLEEMLSSYPEAVKEFFAIDSNGDSRLDDGFAWRIERFLKPYTQFTRGIIATQVKTNGDRINKIEKDIKQIEDHAKRYEERLRAKFGYMEGNIRRQKATGDFIRNRLGNKEK